MSQHSASHSALASLTATYTDSEEAELEEDEEGPSTAGVQILCKLICINYLYFSHC